MITYPDLKARKKVKYGLEIDDSFPDEKVLVAVLKKVPWYAEFIKYMVSEVAPENFSFHQWKKFLHNVTH